MSLIELATENSATVAPRATGAESESAPSAHDRFHLRPVAHRAIGKATKRNLATPRC
jgi:hypothetical protein